MNKDDTVGKAFASDVGQPASAGLLRAAGPDEPIDQELTEPIEQEAKKRAEVLADDPSGRGPLTAPAFVLIIASSGVVQVREQHR